MALEEYKVVWQPPDDVVHTVKLMIEPELIDTAVRGSGVKETKAKLELCRRIRNAAAVPRAYLRARPIYFDHLTITRCP